MYKKDNLNIPERFSYSKIPEWILEFPNPTTWTEWNRPNMNGYPNAILKQ